MKTVRQTNDPDQDEDESYSMFENTNSQVDQTRVANADDGKQVLQKVMTLSFKNDVDHSPFDQELNNSFQKHQFKIDMD